MGKNVEKFLAGILVIAIIAVIISKNARTSQVIQSAASAFANILAVVVAPVSGAVTGSTMQPSDVVVVPNSTPSDHQAN